MTTTSIAPAATTIEVRQTFSYRCSLRHPNAPLPETGTPEEFIQLRAPNAEEAQRLAFHVTGKTVVDAMRIEG